MNLSDIKPYLTNLKKRGGQYTAACPVCHDDHHLYVKQAGDKVLMYCQKCNAQFKDIIDALGIEPKRSDHTDKPAVIEEYDHIYRDTDGSFSYAKRRTKYANGKKKFTFWYEVDGRKVYRKPPEANSLYNLDLMEKATSCEVLYIVEGEKCADAMVKAGFLATTTNAGGKEKIVLSETDMTMLRKFSQKVVIPDNDAVGKQYAKNFKDADILDLKDIWREVGEKEDVYDYLQIYDGSAIREYSFTPIEEMDAKGILREQTFAKIMGVRDEFARQQLVSQYELRAKELKVFRTFQKNLTAYKIMVAKREMANAMKQTNFNGADMQIACGEWIADDFGIRKNEIKSNGDFVLRYASPFPVMPRAILYNLDEQTEKIKLDFWKNNVQQSVTCDRSQAANTSKIIELSNKGLEVNSDNAKYLVKYIADCVALNLDTLPRLESIGRMGWIGERFMPYTDDIVFDGEREFRPLYAAICSAGDIDVWIEEMRTVRENIPVRLAMAASFASPIIEKVGALPFIFHLWGLTGTGKTVALMVAMSIWGDPRMGRMVKTMNMTANAMMETAGFLHNLPFAGDELQTIKQRGINYDSLIMRVTEGIGRGRMSYDKVQDIKTWKCAFLFTGEEPCTQLSSGGGTKNRVIECECEGALVADGHRTATAVAQNFGHAGIVFLERLKERDLTNEYKGLLRKILDELDTTDKQAMALALMLLADDIAREIFWPNEVPLTMDDVRPFAKSQADIDPAERSYEWVVNFISRNAYHFADDVKGESWGRIDPVSVLINKDVLTEAMSENGFSFDSVKKVWARKGYLVRDSQGKFRHQRKIGSMTTSFIKLNLPKGEVEENPF